MEVLNAITFCCRTVIKINLKLHFGGIHRKHRRGVSYLTAATSVTHGPNTVEAVRSVVANTKLNIKKF